ncbi:MAG: glycosyltransferase family 4 protein [Deltaproteobacteria bacterium]|nr:glycosyltransferase family 4 protein [Deltaproteobacteria bacterium]
MKVGVFINSNLPQVGGAYSFEWGLFNSLIKLHSQSKHSFLFYLSNNKPCKKVLENNLKYIYLHRTFKERFFSRCKNVASATLKKSLNPRIPFKVESAYDKHILDSLLTNGIDITWSLSPGCLSMEIPYITTVFDLQHRLQPYFPEVSKNGEWNSREKNYSVILRRASIIIVGTETGRKEIGNFYNIPLDRIKILPFPAPVSFLNVKSNDDKKVLQKYHIDKNYLFYPAQFWAHKNHANLLLAVKYLKDHFDLNFNIVFVGSDMGNISYVKKLINDLNLSEQVHLLGFVPQEDLRPLYRNAFALTFVSFFGPDNLPPLEAFSLACPVIASKISGSDEQLGDAALLVDPGSPEQIANAIISLYRDEGLRETLVQRGLKRSAKWTCDDYIKSVFSILDEFEPIRRCWDNRAIYKNPKLLG